MILLLVILFVAIVESSGLQCPSQQHLTDQGTGGSDSLPLLVKNVSATSSYLDFQDEKIFAFEYPIDVSSTNAWCSGTIIDSFPNVTITMTEPVVLYALLSGGIYNQLTSQYFRVTAFSLEYSETAEGDVVPFQLQGDTMRFTEPNTKIPLVLLPRPILATTFHFHVTGFFGNLVTSGACWTLALIGCPQSAAIADIEEDTASIQSVSSVPSLFPTPLATPTTETPDVQPEEGRGEGGRESDSQAVAIAVSTSLLTVLAVAVIVAVGVILCWRISSKNRLTKHKQDGEQRERVYTIRTVENELYTDPNTSDKPGQMYEEPKSPSSSSQSQTQETMDDVLYATPNTNTTANHLQVYEPVQPSAGGGGGGSMVDNPQYLATAGVDLADMTESPLVQNDEGYEMMSPAAAGRGGKWEEHHSHTYANTETVRVGEDDTPQ